jgi:hypothetical protein
MVIIYEFMKEDKKVLFCFFLVCGEQNIIRDRISYVKCMNFPFICENVKSM